MEENISENSHALVKLAQSREISDKEGMDLLLPIGHIDAQSKENPQGCEITVEGLRVESNSTVNTTENTVSGLVNSSKRSLLKYLRVHSNQKDSVCEESAKLAQSGEISDKEGMDLLLPIRHIDAQSKENPQGCEITVEGLRVESNSTVNTTKNTPVSTVSGLVNSSKRSLLKPLRVRLNQKDSVCEESAKLAQSSEISDKEGMDLLLPIGYVDAQSKENPQGCEITVEGLRVESNSTVNTTENTPVSTVSGLVNSSKRSLLKPRRVHLNKKNSVCEESAKLAQSSEISDKEGMDLLLPIGYVDAQSKKNPQDCEITVEDLRDESNSTVNTMENTPVSTVSGLVNSSKRSLLKPLPVHSNQKDNVCEECGKTFSQRRYLKRHLRVHKNEKLFSCDLCGKSFIDNWSLKSHLRSHTKEKLYACDICSKTFGGKGSLRCHLLRVHTNEKPFVCQVCNKAFVRNSDLKSHSVFHSKEKPHCCEVCNKTFARRSTLKNHLLTHSKEKPYACEICGKAFSQRGNLAEHLRIHTKEKPYCCDVCNKAFSNSCNLKTHFRIHTKEKPYACEVCGKSFTGSGNLKLHLSTHSNEKPFACEVCSKTFSRNGDLKSHFVTHSKEKPYACEVCAKTFARSSDLKYHVITHSKEKSYPCEVCFKMLSDSRSLRRHLNIHRVEKRP